MTQNQSYNTLIKLLKARGYKCSNKGKIIGKERDIIEKDGKRLEVNLHVVVGVNMELFTDKEPLKAIERTFQFIKKRLEAESDYVSFETFYDENMIT